MTASRYDFPQIIKGDTFDGLSFTLSVNTVLVDFTDAIITMDLRLDKTGVSVKRFTSVGDADITIESPKTSGKFKFNSQIINVDAGIYYYDIQILFPNTVVKTYIEGRWTILQDVTYG